MQLVRTGPTKLISVRYLLIINYYFSKQTISLYGSLCCPSASQLATHFHPICFFHGVSDHSSHTCQRLLCSVPVFSSWSRPRFPCNVHRTLDWCLPGLCNSHMHVEGRLTLTADPSKYINITNCCRWCHQSSFGYIGPDWSKNCFRQIFKRFLGGTTAYWGKKRKKQLIAGFRLFK